MPYHIEEEKGKFHIIRTEDGVKVGSSDTKEKAERSIGYRTAAEEKKKPRTTQFN